MERRACLVAVLLLIGGARSACSDWPQFRHDAAHTACTDESLAPPLRLKWRVVDVTNPRPDDVPADGDGHYYLNIAGGWVRSVRIDSPNLLAAEDALVVLRDGWPTLTCLDAGTGRERWRREVRARRAWMIGIERGILVLYGDLIPRRGKRESDILGCDIATGETVWAFNPDQVDDLVWQSFSPPAAVNHGLVCLALIETHTGSWMPYLYFTHVTDGSPVRKYLCIPSGIQGPEWMTPIKDVAPAAAWGRDLLLLCHAGLYNRQGRLQQRGPWSVSSAGFVSPTPDDPDARCWSNTWPGGVVLAEDQGVAVGYSQDSRLRSWYLSCRDAETGEPIWRQPLGSVHNWNHPPATDQRTLYLGLGDGFVYALDTMSGVPVWRTKVGEPLRAREDLTISAFPPICSLSADTLWVVYRGSLLALDPQTGELQWETDETDGCWYEPVIHDGCMYLLTYEGIEAWEPGDEEQTAAPEDEATDPVNQ